MRSLLPFPLLSLSTLAFASQQPPISVLKGHTPIYLGDAFWPPSMMFLAWIPTEENRADEWCRYSADASDEALFSLDGFEELKVHDYFSEQAYLTYHSHRFANCVITPESIKLPGCDRAETMGLVERGGKKEINPIFMGPANRKWSCWVVGAGEGGNRSHGEEMQEILGGKLVLTGDGEAEETGANGKGGRPSTGGEVKGVFTPVATATAGSW